MNLLQESATVDTLDDWRATQVIIVLSAALLLAGLVVGAGRQWLGQKDSAASLVRSWIAISLVIGLLVFVAVALAIDDEGIRNVLIGALAANVGAAIAFYFSTKASDQARQDILDATFGVERVPDLKDKDLDEARKLLGGTSLSLSVVGAATTGTVKDQDPPKDVLVRKGTTIAVTLQ